MTYVPVGQLMPQQGWQCPICSAVYAPFVPQCFSCKPVTTTTPTITWSLHETDQCPNTFLDKQCELKAGHVGSCGRTQFVQWIGRSGEKTEDGT